MNFSLEWLHAKRRVRLGNGVERLETMAQWILGRSHFPQPFSARFSYLLSEIPFRADIPWKMAATTGWTLARNSVKSS